jgi:hypothetical protein
MDETTRQLLAFGIATRRALLQAEIESLDRQEAQLKGRRKVTAKEAPPSKRPMSASQKKAISKRMKAMWASKGLGSKVK